MKSDGFAANDQPVLFYGEGLLSEEDVLFLEEEQGIVAERGAFGEISSLFRSRSFISIGDPIVLPFAQLLTERGEAVSAAIKLQMLSYDFYLVQLACSFQAAPNCRFHDARFSLELQTSPSDISVLEASPGNAIAYDLFPLKLEDERKVRVTWSFHPELKFTFDPISSSLTLPLYDRESEYVTYTSRVEAFDLQGTQPAWKFVRTASHDISGPQKLFMTLRKPKGTQVKAIFSLTAHVQFLIGRVVLNPYPLKLLFRGNEDQSTITDAPSAPLC
jgi:hypothetical protein